MYDVQAAILIVLFLTLVVVALYTHETHLLRLQHIRPYVLLIRHGNNDYRLFNVGNGTALNIRATNAKTKETAVEVSWDPLPKLGPGEQSQHFFKGHDPIIDAYL
ncbi:MAG: hypothetical protein L0Z53_15295, partial [Acidobacteriales bacterium]|nr:hypothetical protein [Terriglobales bacterium]